jgi:hypothetical protein
MGFVGSTVAAEYASRFGGKIRLCWVDELEPLDAGLGLQPLPQRDHLRMVVLERPLPAQLPKRW